MRNVEWLITSLFSYVFNFFYEYISICAYLFKHYGNKNNFHFRARARFILGFLYSAISNNSYVTIAITTASFTPLRWYFDLIKGSME